MVVPLSAGDSAFIMLLVKVSVEAANIVSCSKIISPLAEKVKPKPLVDVLATLRRISSEAVKSKLPVPKLNPLLLMALPIVMFLAITETGLAVSIAAASRVISRPAISVAALITMVCSPARRERLAVAPVIQLKRLKAIGLPFTSGAVSVSVMLAAVKLSGAGVFPAA